MNSSMKKRLPGKKLPMFILCLLIIAGMGVGGTLAYLMDNSGPVENVFTPAEVEGELHESFDGSAKSSISVENTGNIPTYIRVMLAPYWVDADDNPIAWLGGWTPSFSLGTDWLKIGNYYYYTKPVAVGASTSDLTGSNITLTTDTETGYKQALDVFAECIQSTPETAVESAWNVTVENGVITG